VEVTKDEQARSFSGLSFDSAPTQKPLPHEQDSKSWAIIGSGFPLSDRRGLQRTGLTSSGLRANRQAVCCLFLFESKPSGYQ
jgi:hypothetical protein